jgi:hypothetical protein
MNVNDKVLSIERFGDLIFKWESTVIAIESNYIETTYVRDYRNEILMELCKKLAPNHRTFSKQYVRNYYAPDGSINIEEIKNDYSK